MTLTDNILQHFDIIPSSSKLNLQKGQNSAKESVKRLKDSIINSNLNKASSKDSKAEMAAGATQTIFDALFRDLKTMRKISKQEKKNLRQLSLEQKRKQKNNPNAPKKTSEEFIIYELKQQMKGSGNDIGGIRT